MRKNRFFVSLSKEDKDTFFITDKEFHHLKNVLYYRHYQRNRERIIPIASSCGGKNKTPGPDNDLMPNNLNKIRYQAPDNGFFFRKNGEKL